MRVLAARGLGEILSFDFRYPRTLKALLFPGRLTRAYLEGRRAPYVPPLRLALGSTLLLLAVVVVTGRGDAVISVSSSPLEDMNALARNSAWTTALSLLLVTLPLAALLRRVLRRRYPLYLAHLVFATHLHSAFMLAFSVVLGLFATLSEAAASTLGEIVLSALLGPYLLVALRTVYGLSWKRTFLLWPLLALAYLLFFALVLLASMGLHLLLRRAL